MVMLTYTNSHHRILSAGEKVARKGLPISSFADNLHLKVINATGRRDGVGGSYRSRIFVIFAMT